MSVSLQGKVVIVTGASSGIGAAAARELVRQGCKVVLGARSEDRLKDLERELGPAAVAVRCDVTSDPEVARLASTALERFGRIDVLFANAGIYVPGPLAEADVGALVRMVDVNVNGVLRCTRAVLPHMLARRSGDIVVTSSISGHIDIHFEPVYSATKHAVRSLVNSLRRQVLAHGVRVGALSPGMVANELWGVTTPEGVAKHVAARSALTNEDVVDALIFMITRPPHVNIRDVLMFPQAQDI